MKTILQNRIQHLHNQFFCGHGPSGDPWGFQVEQGNRSAGNGLGFFKRVHEIAVKLPDPANDPGKRKLMERPEGL